MLQEPVALLVQVADHLLHDALLLLLVGELCLVVAEVSLEICLGPGLLLRQAHVRLALLGGVGQGLLVVLLGLGLVRLCQGYLLLKVRFQLSDHGEDAVALGHLGLVAAVKGCRGRHHLPAGGLKEGIGVEGVLGGGVHELAGIVKLIQAVLCQIQQLDSLSVGRNQLLRRRREG